MYQTIWPSGTIRWRASLAQALRKLGLARSLCRLKPLGDIEQYKFEDWRNQAVRLEGDSLYSAVYSRPGEAWVLLANFSAVAKRARCEVRGTELPYPLATVASAEILAKNGAVRLNAGKLSGEGEIVEIPSDDVVLIRLR